MDVPALTGMKRSVDTEKRDHRILLCFDGMRVSVTGKDSTGRAPALSFYIW